MRERRHGQLIVQLALRQWSMLFFQLTAALSLLSLDTFSLYQRQHLLVLDAELSPAQLVVVERVDDHSRLFCRCEVCKGQAAEDAIVEMVVEGVGQREIQLGHQLDQLLFLHGEGNIFDDNGGGDQFIIHFGRR